MTEINIKTDESVPEISEKNKPDDTKKSERTFTQSELEKCIGERLQRERRNNTCLLDIKKLVDTLCEKGVINATSYAQAERELFDKLTCLEVKNTETAYGGDEHCENDESFNIKADAGLQNELPSENDTENPVDTSLSAGICEKKEALSENPVSELLELCEKHPETEPERLLRDADFISYCRGKNGTLCELYESFISLTDALDVFSESRRMGYASPRIHDRRAVNAISSTGFSQQSASESSDYSTLLSPTQRSIAKRAGISYSEYAQLLRDIPDGSKINKQR